ncbi:hypothetical protein GQ457_06G036040 [Hibiscus cannabinus]
MLCSLSISTSLPGFQPSLSSPSRARFRPSTAAASTNTSTYASKQECKSLYEVLGIAVGASNLEIKAAYRRLARVCHPDVAEAGRKDLSAEEFMKIHAVYSTLSDPEKRAVYDGELNRRSQRPLTWVSKFTGYGGRRWETDQCW